MKLLQKPYHENGEGQIHTYMLKRMSGIDDPLISILKVRRQCEDSGDYLLFNLVTADNERVSAEQMEENFEPITEKNLDRIYFWLVYSEEIMPPEDVDDLN